MARSKFPFDITSSKFLFDII